MGFKEFMENVHPMNRWAVSCVFMIGMFAGACITTMVLLFGWVG